MDYLQLFLTGASKPGEGNNPLTLCINVFVIQCLVCALMVVMEAFL